MTDLVQENALLKGKIVTLNETLNSTELESKASRETIMRLVSEVGKEQKVATRFTSEVDNLRLVGFLLFLYIFITSNISVGLKTETKVIKVFVFVFSRKEILL